MSAEASKREKALMGFLWEQNRPVTSLEIFEELADVMCNITYVHRTLTALENKGMIRAVGLVKVNSKYARTFIYLKSREEVAAEYAKEMGINAKHIGKFALALVKDEDDDKEAREKLITELEEIIAELREEEDGE